MNILHIASFNTANVPLTFVKAERKLGHESRLVTLSPHHFEYEEDICLHLPFLDNRSIRWLKKWTGISSEQSVFSMIPTENGLPLQWKPHNYFEKLFHFTRDKLWEPYIINAIEKYRLDQYDIYQLDGGLGFLRSGKIINDLHRKGKIITCCYLGSDLRRRGVIHSIDTISSANFTVEFDLLQWYPGIQYVPFPFDVDSVKPILWQESSPMIIGHAPSNRIAKGSDLIIKAVESLAKTDPVSLCLIEGKTHKEALEMKRQCHIFIDQLGPLGYGINTLESLAMGIPTCSSLAQGFADMYPDHQIVEITPENIVDVLRKLVRNSQLCKEKGKKGSEWVQKFHDSRRIVQLIHDSVFPLVQRKNKNV